MRGQPIVLVAVAGAETPAFWDRVRELLPRGAGVELFHVVDEAPVRELGMVFGRHPGRSQPAGVDARIREAESRGSETILGEARAAVGSEAQVATGRGRPEQEIVNRARDLGAALVVVGARPGETETPPAPHSLGHVSRYVVDHAPCPVLLVRL